MRIPDRFYTDSMQRGLAQSSQRLDRLSYQLTSGKRLQRPSDEPEAAGAILQAQADLRRCLARQNGALEQALSRVEAADAPLSDATTALSQAHSILLQGLNASSTEEVRQGMSLQIEGIVEFLADIANRQMGGRYLLAGTADTAPPVTQDASGAYLYRGNDDQQLFPVAPGRSAPGNVTGSAVFNFRDSHGQRAVPGVDADAFAVLGQAAQQLADGDEEGMRASLEQVAALRVNVIEQRGVLGTYAVRLQAAQDAGQDEEVRVRTALSGVEDVDIAQAIIEMQSLQVAFQAALATVGKMASQPTIFQFLD